jgi:23S rRNA pseudouridine955/2504/2580 synthase
MKPQVSHSKREVEIDEGSAGQRIDNFLLKSLKGVPKSRIYRILRKGEVRVNKGRIKPDYRLKLGDSVRIPPIRVSEQETGRTPGNWILKAIEDSILYEDERLLILNKPSGLAVHGGSGISFGVIEGLRALRPEAPFLELGHRLDRDTSGCLVIAKRRSALRSFHELLRSGKMEKYYLALVRGQWRQGRKGIDAPLRKNTLRSGERIVTVSEEGKAALSIFEPVTIYSQASLVRVKLITGRTHQVRVHALHADHPIAGDSKYGDSEFNHQMAELGLKRLFLHASDLRFTLPGEEREIDVHAPLQIELQQVLDRLEPIEEF